MEKSITFISDFFGVIAGEMAPLFFAKHFGEKGKEIKNYYFEKTDLGEISFDDTIAKICNDYHLDLEEVRKEFNSYVKVDNEVISLLKEIKNNANLVLLSNAGEHIVEDILARFDIKDLFDYEFISYKFHKAKPDPSFFEMAKNSTPNAKKFYMLDDNPSNLTNLNKIDIQPILFKNSSQLKIDLIKNNLI